VTDFASIEVVVRLILALLIAFGAGHMFHRLTIKRFLCSTQSGRTDKSTGNQISLIDLDRQSIRVSSDSSMQLVALHVIPSRLSRAGFSSPTDSIGR
jgi:hypothetical protein